MKFVERLEVVWMISSISLMMKHEHEAVGVSVSDAATWLAPTGRSARP